MDLSIKEKEQLRMQILDCIDLTREVDDEELQNSIESIVWNYGKHYYLTLEEKGQLCKELFYSLRKLDVLQELLEDSSITEIMINGKDCIFFEKEGRIQKWNKQFLSKQKLEDIIQQMVSKANRMVNEKNPIVDTRLENGSRVNVVLNPIALNGPIVTIRRFPDSPVLMKQLIEWGSITKQAATFLENLVVSGYNLFVSGGTGSGKTTFLNALSQYIPKDERIITIEDSAELQIQGLENLVRLETRNANTEGDSEITMRDLIRSSLRMRPDRIVIGEVRGAEALDMLQAMNTGHDGSLSTGHANSSKDMLSRLEIMVLTGIELPLLAIRSQIASAIDILIHVERMRDKTRKVMNIVEILGMENGEIQLFELYKFFEVKEEGGKIVGELKKMGNLQNLEKLQKAGR